MVEAAFRRTAEGVQSMRAQPFGETANDSDRSLRLASAVKEGDLAAVRQALTEGADPNHRDAKGRGLLMTAVFDGDREMVEALVEAGAEVNLIGKYGNTAMDIAADADNHDMVVYLREHGAQQGGKGTSEQAAPSADY